jgi:hypothetical protein
VREGTGVSLIFSSTFINRKNMWRSPDPSLISTYIGKGFYMINFNGSVIGEGYRLTAFGLRVVPDESVVVKTS